MCHYQYRKHCKQLYSGSAYKGKHLLATIKLNKLRHFHVKWCTIGFWCKNDIFDKKQKTQVSKPNERSKRFEKYINRYTNVYNLYISIIFIYNIKCNNLISQTL